MSDHLEIIHTPAHDPSINSLFVPGIKVRSGYPVYFSGVTAAPVYHDHPHIPEDFDSIPLDAEAQARLTFDHLDQALAAAGCQRGDLVMLTRFLVDVEGDQDVINRLQGEFLGDHLPTSATVQIVRLATDARLRLEIQAVAIAPD